MGSLGGHLLPGIFFIIAAFYWSFITAIRYAQSRLRSPIDKTKLVGYHASVTMPPICLPCKSWSKKPFESYLKLFFTTVGIIIELIGGFKNDEINGVNRDNVQFFGCGDESGYRHGVHSMSTVPTTHQPHNHEMHAVSNMSISNMVQHLDLPRPFFKSTFSPQNTQHITMYAAFLLGSVVEILIYKGYDIPRKLDYICGIIAFAIEGFLFFFHLHSRAPLDISLHIYLTIAIFGCVLGAILEFMNPRQIIHTYVRILFTFLQGTWFCHIGFVLYPPYDIAWLKWDRCNHEHIMLTTMLFCWHFMIIFVALLAQLFIIKRCYKRKASDWDELIYIDEENFSRSMKIHAQFFNSSDIRFLRLDSGDEDEEISSDETKTESTRLHLDAK